MANFKATAEPNADVPIFLRSKCGFRKTEDETKEISFIQHLLVLVPDK
jgi:hypothetical protein